MAGTTGLEPATSAVTATTWKSTDGTASHWKYVEDNVIVYRDVYRGRAPNSWNARYFANASTTSCCIRTFMAPALSIVAGGGK